MTNIKTLGDPHLGKEFKNGVPLHRRGEREAQQWAEFKRHLNDLEIGDVHVCMGDLFDAFSVDEAVVLRAADIYIQAAHDNDGVEYFILRGNHDAVRDADKKSSFDVFAALVADVENITVVSERAVVQGDYLFCPWHPFKAAKEIVVEAGRGPQTVAFGHWDLREFGEENPNKVPLVALVARGIKLAITGHEHTPCDTTFKTPGGEIRVIGTGSMLPYSHGEDPHGAVYVTKTLAEVLADPTLYKDKCLRVLLATGEELPEVDCLQLTSKKIDDLTPDAVEVSLAEFDFEALFKAVFEEAGVDTVTTNEVWGFYQSLRSASA
jgi:hypothetical protein